MKSNLIRLLTLFVGVTMGSGLAAQESARGVPTGELPTKWTSLSPKEKRTTLEEFISYAEPKVERAAIEEAIGKLASEYPFYGVGVFVDSIFGGEQRVGNTIVMSFAISAIWKGSPAAEAGLRPDFSQRVASWNGEVCSFQHPERDSSTGSTYAEEYNAKRNAARKTCPQKLRSVLAASKPGPPVVLEIEQRDVKGTRFYTLPKVLLGAEIAEYLDAHRPTLEATLKESGKRLTALKGRLQTAGQNNTKLDACYREFVELFGPVEKARNELHRLLDSFWVRQ